jgi:hypothetical protein
LDEHAGSPLHRAVQWFKTMTTNEYIHCVKKNGRLSTKKCGNAIIMNTSLTMNNRIWLFRNMLPTKLFFGARIKGMGNKNDPKIL